MRKYYEYIKNSFKENLAYRVEYFTAIAQTLLALLVQLYLWRAIIGQAGGVSSNAGTITLGDMTTYVLMGTLIGTLLGNSLIADINDRVRNGQISTDLIKPMNFIIYMFCRMIGRSFFSFLFRLLPVLIVGIIFLDLHLPTLPDFMFFCISIINSLVVTFMIVFTLGLLAFWYMAMWQVDIFLGTLMTLLSGRFLPLWFFPQFLVSISYYLPFRLMYFVPISIYLGKLETADCWYAILQQLLWIIVLYGIMRVMWSASVKKLVFQGG